MEVSDSPYTGAETCRKIIEVLDRLHAMRRPRLVRYTRRSEKGNGFVNGEPRNVNDTVSAVPVECVGPRPGQGVGHDRGKLRCQCRNRGARCVCQLRPSLPDVESPPERKPAQRTNREYRPFVLVGVGGDFDDGRGGRQRPVARSSRRQEIEASGLRVGGTSRERPRLVVSARPCAPERPTPGRGRHLLDIARSWRSKTRSLSSHSGRASPKT